MKTLKNAIKEPFICYKKAMKNYFVPKGRASRKEYWLFMLVFGILSLLVLVLDHGLYSAYSKVLGNTITSKLEAWDVTLIWLIFIVVHIMPAIMLQIRRMHDLELSGWYILIPFIPFVGIVFFAMVCTFGTNGDNKYGEALVLKESYDEQRFIKKFFKFSVGMLVANLLYLVAFIYINFDKIINWRVLVKSSNEFGIFAGTIGYGELGEAFRMFFIPFLNVTIPTLICIIAYIIIARKLKQNVLTKKVTVLFNGINFLIVSAFIIFSLLFFANIPYYHPDRPVVYKYRPAEYIEKTSNYKEYVELCKQMTNKMGELEKKYASKDEVYFDINKIVDPNALDIIYKESDEELNRYKGFVEKNVVVFSNDRFTEPPQQSKLLSIYKIQMHRITKSLEDGKLSEEEIKKYDDLWGIFEDDMKHKNTLQVDGFIDLARLGAIIEPFESQDISISEEDASVIKEKLHNIKNKLPYNHRDSMLTDFNNSREWNKILSIFPFIYGLSQSDADMMLLFEHNILEDIEKFDSNYIAEVDKARNRIDKILKSRVSIMGKFLSVFRNPLGNPLLEISINAYSGVAENSRRKLDNLYAMDYLINHEMYSQAPKSMYTQLPMVYSEDENYKKVTVMSKAGDSKEKTLRMKKSK